jgi:hypothetical protein
MIQQREWKNKHTRRIAEHGQQGGPQMIKAHVTWHTHRYSRPQAAGVQQVGYPNDDE